MLVSWVVAFRLEERRISSSGVNFQAVPMESVLVFVLGSAYVICTLKGAAS